VSLCTLLDILSHIAEIPLFRSVSDRMAASKKILSVGLGRFASFDANAIANFGPDAGKTTKGLLQSSIEKANAAGFEIVAEDANPRDPEDTLRRLTETLQSGDYVGVNIGYGLRGNK